MNSYILMGTMHRPERRDRQNKRGGGLLAHINSALNYTRRSDLETIDVEIMWLQIERPRTNKFLIGYIYRPPSAKAETSRSIELSCENALKIF